MSACRLASILAGACSAIRCVVYGFDAIHEAIDRLTEKGRRPNRVYRALALGNEDGERTFYVPANTFASRSGVANMEVGARSGEGRPGPRNVPIRKLDTLFAAGEIPLADYIKIDTEGFEAGGAARRENVLGALQHPLRHRRDLLHGDARFPSHALSDNQRHRARPSPAAVRHQLLALCAAVLSRRQGQAPVANHRPDARVAGYGYRSARDPWTRCSAAIS